MKNVAILAFSYTALFELSCAVELFALPRPEFEDWYNAEVVSFEPEPLRAAGGLQLSAKHVNNLDEYDMVIIPNWQSTPTAIPQALRNALEKQLSNNGRLISFCSGAFLLAEVNAFTNRQVTTHWQYADVFKQRFPSLNYVEDVLYIYDGEVGCSAGSASAIDLSLAVIREDFGYEVANQVARRLVLPAHRSGGQSQFIETPILEKPALFAQTLDWALQHLSDDISIDTLAKKAAMSRRTFDRKFRASLNTPPKQWLTEQRLNLAKQRLETTHCPIEQVASETGFSNAMTFRHHFRKHLQLSPTEYRAQFRSRT